MRAHTHGERKRGYHQFRQMSWIRDLRPAEARRAIVEHPRTVALRELDEYPDLARAFVFSALQPPRVVFNMGRDGEAMEGYVPESDVPHDLGALAEFYERAMEETLPRRVDRVVKLLYAPGREATALDAASLPLEMQARERDTAPAFRPEPMPDTDWLSLALGWIDPVVSMRVMSLHRFPPWMRLGVRRFDWRWKQPRTETDPPIILTSPVWTITQPMVIDIGEDRRLWLVGFDDRDRDPDNRDVLDARLDSRLCYQRLFMPGPGPQQALGLCYWALEPGGAPALACLAHYQMQAVGRGKWETCIALSIAGIDLGRWD